MRFWCCLDEVVVGCTIWKHDVLNLDHSIKRGIKFKLTQIHNLHKILNLTKTSMVQSECNMIVKLTTPQPGGQKNHTSQQH